MKPRRGFALLELLVSGVLIVALVQVGWWVVAVQGGVAARVVDEARYLDAARVTRRVLSAEVHQSGSEGDFELTASEVRLRSFRGVAVFCEGDGVEWWVNTGGHRRFDSGKDSVLVFDPHEGWQTRAVLRRTAASGRCPPVDGFREERWTFESLLGTPVVGKYFERGGYRFSDGAFRSLQGRGGWHPVTEANVDSDLSLIEGVGRRGVRGRMVWANRGRHFEPVSWLSWARW